jgi:hypothetical protein
MTSVVKLSAVDRQTFAQEGLAELNAVLKKLAPSDRKAFWTAVRGCYELEPEDQHTISIPVQQPNVDGWIMANLPAAGTMRVAVL